MMRRAGPAALPAALALSLGAAGVPSPASPPTDEASRGAVVPAAILVAGVPVTATAAPFPPGVAVEEVRPGLAGEAAGLLREIEIEHLPGPVRFAGLRAGTPLAVEMRPDGFGLWIDVRPAFPAPLLELDERQVEQAMAPHASVAVLPAALALVLGAAGVPVFASPPTDGSPRGAVVERVTKAGAAERAGLRPGDEILAWSREARPPANPEAARGALAVPLDLGEVEVEQAPRGPLTLVGRRGAEAAQWAVPPGDWGLEARPALEGRLLELYEQGRERRDAKATDEAVRLWRQAAGEANEAGTCAVAGWFLALAGKALGEARRWEELDAAYREAVEASACEDRPVRTALLVRDGCWAMRRRPRPPVVDCVARVVETVEKIAPDSLVFALTVADVAILGDAPTDLEAAERRHRQALAIRERQAPDSDAVASSHNHLGIVAHTRGDLETAEKHYQQALQIREALVPDSLELARVLNGLGELWRYRGDLRAAEDFHQRALAIRMRLVPEGLDTESSLNNLGIVARHRGDLSGSERYLMQALRLTETAPDGRYLRGSVLNNLGNTARDQGDLDAAESFFRQALALFEELTPGTLRVANGLNNVGLVALDRGKLTEAAELFRRSLAIKEKGAPGSLDLAVTLDNLAQVAQAQGDLAGAEARGREALAIREKDSPGSLAVAESLWGLGETARARGDLRAAEQHLRAALEIQEKVRPGSVSVADSLHALGTTLRQDGRPGPAAEALCGALDALDSQRQRLGGSYETRSAFGARYADHYHACLESLVEQGRAAEAFHILERSRARALLELLAERDLVDADVPAALEQRRRRTGADYDRVQSELEPLDASKDAAESERLRARLRDLRTEQQRIRDEIRRSSPRFAALQYAQPLDLPGVRATLDPGTVLLAYAVGKDRSHAFVIGPGPADVPVFEVFPIPLGRQALHEKVRAFRERIQRAGPEQELAAEAGALYDALVGPADARISAADRVLICPDGPLHTLPFAALRRKGHYFVEWKPQHTVISATVYAELRRSRPDAPGKPSVLAFGDPRYPSPHGGTSAIVDPAVSDSVKRGLDLKPLPASRHEVEAIAGLYGRATRVYVGEHATEERVKSEAGRARYLHFACHGFLDERMPLNSGLALTIREHPAEGQDNGLLQAWEVFERVRLDADLVTLSACDSGLGKEMGGEGLIGLTRAFQYAGARSVVASLWSVADRSTAELMRHFYRGLRRGLPKDEALRRAQLALIHAGPRRSHPLRWAGFQLFGDWK